MADNEQEMIALLREIRDVQRAHFERYQEYTAAALKHQEEAGERKTKLMASSAQSRETNDQYRLQTLQILAETRRSATNTRLILWASMALQVALIFALCCIILELLKR
jgi:hypothetical protein